MNKRIRKKIYKRAEEKLFAEVKPGETRSIQQIAKDDSILSPLEYKVFQKVQRKMLRVFEEVKVELIAEGKW